MSCAHSAKSKGREPFIDTNADVRSGAFLRHAGMDGRHPGLQDASGDIHVNLDFKRSMLE
jgi:hypothetical protein